MVQNMRLILLDYKGIGADNLKIISQKMGLKTEVNLEI
jgi:hypothetical protein